MRLHCARIEEDAQLEAALVLPGARVGSGAKIRHAIVAENAVVAPHARIGYDSEADRAQFPVSKNGIVIVGAPPPGQTGVPRAIQPSVKCLR